MPYETPSLSTLYSRIAADINSRLTGADSRPRRSLLGVLAAVLAALAWGLYRFQTWITRQIFVATADEEWLARHAAFYGVARKAATYATATARVTGVDAQAIAKGTRLRRSGGIELLVVDEALIVDGSADLSIRAVDAGVAGNAELGELLSFVSPVVKVSSTGTVTAVGDVGYDEETLDDWRDRIAAVRAKPGRGGDKGDYVIWALEVAGVTRAWCYPLENGPGTVVVRFVTDNTTANGIPTSEAVQLVQAHIDAVRPVTVRSAIAAAPIAAPVACSIDVPASARSAVKAELAALFGRDASPGATMRIARMRAAVSAAAIDYTMTIPSADIPHEPNQLPVLGDITWL